MYIDQLVGKTFTKVTETGEELVFLGEKSYKFWHEQDCCEDVRIEDITGDLKDLEGSPITLAEEVSNGEWDYDKSPNEEYIDSFTWTFYKFATVKGYVTVRWLGTSNGWYSEGVNFGSI